MLAHYGMHVVNTGLIIGPYDDFLNLGQSLDPCNTGRMNVTPLVECQHTNNSGISV